MAARKATKPVEPDISDVSTAPDEWEFETVAEEAPTRVVFDEFGDVFVGQYVGTEHIEQPIDEKGIDQSFDLLNFRARDGQLYAINSSYKLVEAMGKVDEGDWVRITYVKDLPTKRGLNPMKDFVVDRRTK